MTVFIREIIFDEFGGIPDFLDLPVLEPHRVFAQLRDRRHIVADEQDGAAVFRDIAHLADALLLEPDVTDREHLVHDQDLRLQVGGHGERQADVHSA